MDLIDPEHADDYALVVNTTTPLTDAVRSALYRRGIAFKNELNVRDLTQIRDYLQFLTLSLSYPTLRVKHVRELFQSYNARFKPRKDEFLLSKQLEGELYPQTRKLIGLMANIQNYTFREVIDELKHAGFPQVRMLISDMKIADELVTPKLVSDLEYAVNNVSDLHHNEEIPENERSGVLITDCKNSVYIDRPVVIYLGMGQDWNMSVTGKKYLDPEFEMEKNVMRMKILLQQGSKRVYIVNSTKNGQPARPSLMFDQIFGESMETFDKVCKNLVRGQWARNVPEITRDRGESDVDPVKEFDSPFSKTSFDNYVVCPRKFMFNTLIPTPDEKDTEFGNLLHQFAELYVCYPEIVREKGTEFFVQMTASEYAGLSSPLMYGLDSDKVRMAMNNIMRFIDGLNVPEGILDRSADKASNRFFRELDLDMSSSLCETDEHSAEYPMHGRLDLYLNGNVIDYKTGKARDGKTIVQLMGIDDEKNDYVDFQPMIYLALMRERRSSTGEFRLFYATDNDVESLGQGFDVSRNVRTIRLTDDTPKECLLHNPSFREFFGSDRSGSFKKGLKEHSEEIFDIIDSIGSDDPADWTEDSALINNILGVADKKIKEADVKTNVKKLVSKMKNGMVFTDTEVIIPSSTLDTFLGTLASMHALAKEQSATFLPPGSACNCDKCDFKYACMIPKIHVDEGEDD